jgi:hypothetical protein
MASIAEAKAGLVALGATVAKIGGGTLASYDLKGFYDAGASVLIPCLIAVLDLETEIMWEANAMMGGAVRQQFVLQHYLLVKKVAGEADFTVLEPDFVTYADNYFVALAARPYFTPSSAPSIHWSPQGKAIIRRSQWNQVEYHTILFSLECGLNL